ncbi:hypothetical protein SteCoe_7914 [Stentor coeruleus]|uniref:RING-type domain-containing protein n=1 Tax=Stentor coeruleus TaxID=5963 RepID=A0A1R2CLD3_9CILI|nr:hypothetical protein SteCoe_7914 [Stentor coeruleus]
MKKVVKLPVKQGNQPSYYPNDMNSDTGEAYKDMRAPNQNPNAQKVLPNFSYKQGYEFIRPAENPAQMIPDNRNIKHSQSILGDLSTFNEYENKDMNCRSRIRLGSEDQDYYYNQDPYFEDVQSKTSKNPYEVIDDYHSRDYTRRNTVFPSPILTPKYNKPSLEYENPKNYYDNQVYNDKRVGYDSFHESPFSTISQPSVIPSYNPPYQNHPKYPQPIADTSYGYENTLPTLHNPSIPPPLNINPNSNNLNYSINPYMQNNPPALDLTRSTSNNSPYFLQNTKIDTQSIYKQTNPPLFTTLPQTGFSSPSNIPQPPFNNEFTNQNPVPQFQPPPNLKNNPIQPKLIDNSKPPSLNIKPLEIPIQNINYTTNIPQSSYNKKNQFLPDNISKTNEEFTKQNAVVLPPPLNIPVSTVNNSFLTMNPISNTFTSPPPPIISLPPIQIKDIFTVLKESTCLLCNESNPNFLSSCKHLYHIKCIKKLQSTKCIKKLQSSKCVKCPEIIKNGWLDIPSANNCHNCLSAFNLFSCNNCNKKSCISCIMHRDLQGCCGDFEKNKIKLYQQCPGCFYDRSICDLVINTCTTHNFLCKKCWNLSTKIGKCILGCYIGNMRFPDIIQCPECYEFEIKYYGEYLCPDKSCESCDKCMTKRSVSVPECIPYCMCTEPMIKKNIEDLWS